MAKKQPPLLFVDTNIFLDFYRAGGGAGLILLKHLESVADSLIMTDQIEVEFLNNRQNVISSALANLKAPSVPPFTPAYLSDSKTAAGIEKNLKQIAKRMQVLREKFARILEDPIRHDPVFKAVKQVITKSKPLNLKFADTEKQTQICELASKRYQRGFPPRKKADHSIGDAINWEWLLSCARAQGNDVLVVSRDGDFGLALDKTYYLNDWLKQEFKERVSVKKHIELTPSLAQALKKLAVRVSSAEENEEQLIIEQQTFSKPTWAATQADENKNLVSFWPELMMRVGRASPFVRTYLLEVSRAVHDGTFLLIGFEPEFEDHISLVDNARVHSLILTTLKDMGLGHIQNVRFVRLAAQTTSRAKDEVAPAPPTPLDDDVPF